MQISARASARTPPTSPAPRARSQSSEFEACAANGVDRITEVLIGYDGLVFAQSVDGPDFDRLHQGADLSWRSPPRSCSRRRSSSPTPTRPGRRSTPRCPTRQSWSSARHQPRHPRGLRRDGDARRLRRPSPESRRARRGARRGEEACSRIRTGRPVRSTSTATITTTSPGFRATERALGIFGLAFFENNAHAEGRDHGGRGALTDTIASGDYGVAPAVHLHEERPPRRQSPASTSSSSSSSSPTRSPARTATSRAAYRPRADQELAETQATVARAAADGRRRCTRRPRRPRAAAGGDRPATLLLTVTSCPRPALASHRPRSRQPRRRIPVRLPRRLRRHGRRAARSCAAAPAPELPRPRGRAWRALLAGVDDLRRSLRPPRDQNVAAGLFTNPRRSPPRGPIRCIAHRRLRRGLARYHAGLFRARNLVEAMTARPRWLLDSS